MNSRLILGSLAVIALGGGLIYLWSTKQASKKLESPADRYVGVKPRGRATFRFTDLGEYGSHLVQVDYALIQIERRPPSEAELAKPGIAGDSTFDKIKAALTNAPTADKDGWKKTLASLLRKESGNKVEVVAGGSESYLHRRAFQAQMLKVESNADAKDPLGLRFDRSFLLMPAKDNRIIGFENGGIKTKFSRTSMPDWRMVDVENHHLEVWKTYETQTSYNVAAFRISTIPRNDVQPISGGGSSRGSAQSLSSMKKNRNELAESTRSSYEKSNKVEATERPLPKLD